MVNKKEVHRDILVLLKEKRVFKPSKKFSENTNVSRWMKEKGIKNYDKLLEKSKDFKWFWKEAAKEVVNWSKPYKKLLEWKPPYAKWFVGAKYNIVSDALDRHIGSGNGKKVAYIFEDEKGNVKKITYNEIYFEVNKLANVLKKKGIKKGDRVGLYLPMIPQLPIAMLACAKLGAIHSVVFSGFSAAAFRHRMVDCGAKLVITCDGFHRRGKYIDLKKNVDEALKGIKKVKKVIVYRWGKKKVSWNSKKDVWWHRIVSKEKKFCETKILDSTDPLFILYTSGTTGRPKGIVHDHGGYAVGTAITLKWVFDIKEDDVWWCAADIGWITGHSYIVYAPLILGATSVMYEGAPNYPDPSRWWKIIDRHKVNVFYTSPTSIRLFMRYGESWLKEYKLKSLRLLGSVGEPINPEAWMWYYKNIGKKKCQIMDTWWQTETGNFCITPLPITNLKPGSATKPFPGISAEVLNKKGKKITGVGGNLTLLNPWPGMLKGVYKNPKKYFDTYWSRYKNKYLTGDVARKDKSGYFWIQGRSDDVLKVSGHRIGNSEIESALVSHPKVAEAAVIGKPHKIKGEVIIAYVVLNKGIEKTGSLEKSLVSCVSKEIGKIARPEKIIFVEDLPKTRSGKIMRRLIKAKAMGERIKETSTLSNPESLDQIKAIR